MPKPSSRVTLHMAASLDGFIARKDGSVDWMNTSDAFEGGVKMESAAMAAFLKTIDCYVMGARTYELALDFENKGFGWAYGATPTFILTHRDLPRTRKNVELWHGDLAQLINEKLRPAYGSIWVAGGAAVCGECLRRGLADELRYSILPVVIGDGVRFFEGLTHDVALHLVESKAYANGMVELRYDVTKGGRRDD